MIQTEDNQVEASQPIFQLWDPIVVSLPAFIENLLKIMCMHEYKLKSFLSESKHSDSIVFLPFPRYVKDQTWHLKVSDEASCIPFRVDSVNWKEPGAKLHKVSRVHLPPTNFNFFFKWINAMEKTWLPPLKNIYCPT